MSGGVLIVLGVLALLTPLTPGGWLVFVGAELLGIEMLSPHRIKKAYERLTGRKETHEEPTAE